MSEMVERVIKAIEGELPLLDLYDIDKEALGRAIIEAMREPTADMLRAATASEHEHFYPGKSPTSHTWKSLPTMLVKKLWSAMIDAALK